MVGSGVRVLDLLHPERMSWRVDRDAENASFCLERSGSDKVLDVEGLLSELVRLFFFQAEDGIRDADVTGVQTCALPISFKYTNNRVASCERLSTTPRFSSFTVGRRLARRCLYHSSMYWP